MRVLSGGQGRRAGVADHQPVRVAGLAYTAIS